MSLHNPWPPTVFTLQLWQTKIPPQIATDLRQIAPFHGAIFTLTNNLLHNLHQDVKRLTGGHLVPDYATVLSILLEPRPLTESQLTRLRGTSLGTTRAELQLQQSGEADRKRETAPGDSPVATNLPGGDVGGVGKTRKTKARKGKDKNNA